jgi:DNA polymerase
MNAELKNVLAQLLCVHLKLGVRMLELSPECERRLDSLGKKTASEALPRFRRTSLGALSPPSANKIEALNSLREEILKDRACSALFQNKKNIVFGIGNPDCAIMFVGEAPGKEEDDRGEPFVGADGKLLTKMIETMGLKRADVYIAYIVKYRPDMPPGTAGNRKPTRQEMNACLPYMERQIDIVRPKVLVALGAATLEGLFHIERVSIADMRGKWMEYGGIPLMPTYHPAYLLNQSNTANAMREKRKIWEDLMAVMEKEGMEITQKQRGYFLAKSGKESGHE